MSVRIAPLEADLLVESWSGAVGTVGTVAVLDCCKYNNKRDVLSITIKSNKYGAFRALLQHAILPAQLLPDCTGSLRLIKWYRYRYRYLASSLPIDYYFLLLPATTLVSHILALSDSLKTHCLTV